MVGTLLRSATQCAVVLLALAATPARAADAYDGTWYRGEFWSGEYPAGFTVVTDTVLRLRPEIGREAEPQIECPVAAGATYHPWNVARGIADGLAFVSFTRIEEMVIEAPFSAELYPEVDTTPVTVDFAKGDTWRYLAYYGEGAFLMEYDGVRYTGDQSLMEASRSTLPEREKGYDEWLRINCSNHMWGWLYLPDIAGNAALTGPNIVEYGLAADLQ